MRDKLTLLRWIALFEGSSLLLLLFIAMPLKYYASIPLAVKIVGPIHGVLFLVFIGFLLFHFLKRDINLVQLLIGIVSSLIPFGSFIYKAKLLK